MVCNRWKSNDIDVAALSILFSDQLGADSMILFGSLDVAQITCFELSDHDAKCPSHLRKLDTSVEDQIWYNRSAL